MNSISPSETAIFAAGCFWGVEEAFSKVRGVLKTEVGYTGGRVDNPTYERVCTGTTGHAESVQIMYDPRQITYDELLKIFWKIHDPTTLNRQGPDVGEQYRSAIFYHSPEQKRLAEESKEALVQSGVKAVTKISPAGKWWRAEEYHQKYFEKGGMGACDI